MNTMNPFPCAELAAALQNCRGKTIRQALTELRADKKPVWVYFEGTRDGRPDRGWRSITIGRLAHAHFNHLLARPKIMNLPVEAINATLIQRNRTSSGAGDRLSESKESNMEVSREISLAVIG